MSKQTNESIQYVDAATERSIGLSLREIENSELAEFDSVEDFKTQL